MVWIIQVSLMSIILICLVHHILTFFTSTLTVPKIKDLVNSPTQKYQQIFDTFSHNKYNPNSNTNTNTNTNSNTYTPDYTEIDLLPMATDNTTMKDELKMFLKKQLTSL